MMMMMMRLAAKGRNDKSEWNAIHSNHGKATATCSSGQGAVHRDDRENAKMAIIIRTIIFCWTIITEYREQWHSDDTDDAAAFMFTIAEVQLRRRSAKKLKGKIFMWSVNRITRQSFVRFRPFTCLHRIQEHRDRDFFCLLVCVPIAFVHSFRIFLRGMRVAYLARGHYLFVFALAALQSKQLRFSFFWHDKQKNSELKRNECAATLHRATSRIRIGWRCQTMSEQNNRFDDTASHWIFILLFVVSHAPCMK